ncbi:MAG: Fe-S cluster assembly ATPase SufC [Chitinophagaceae bacterium]|nr:Fe-S cluster assembly ATPase SufC [Oligoflexus sp.]
MLNIENLHVRVEEKEVLKGLNLHIKAGEVHAIMGPNGSGKSTLSKVIAGHPEYTVTSGSITYDVNFRPKNILDMQPDERARNGLFLAFQYPIEIPGIPNLEFLRAAFNAVCKHQGVDPMEHKAFDAFVREKAKLLEIDSSFLDRELNVDLSGGEKKRNEILQMAVLNPRLALLDETDSGLDVDSLRIVSEGVNKLKTDDNAIVMITHYHRILNYIKPDFVHVLADGRIVRSGDVSLALEIEERGYDWLLN